MLNVTISAENLEDLKTKIVALARVFTPLDLVHSVADKSLRRNIMSRSQDQTETVESETKVEHVTPEKTAKTKTRGRPKKEDKSLEPVEEISKNLEKNQSPKTVSFGKDDVISALQDFNIKHGLPAARELLSRFGCARISELKPEDFAQFIEACRSQTAE